MQGKDERVVAGWSFCRGQLQGEKVGVSICIEIKQGSKQHGNDAGGLEYYVWHVLKVLFKCLVLFLSKVSNPHSSKDWTSLGKNVF